MSGLQNLRLEKSAVLVSIRFPLWKNFLNGKRLPMNNHSPGVYSSSLALALMASVAVALSVVRNFRSTHFFRGAEQLGARRVDIPGFAGSIPVVAAFFCALQVASATPLSAESGLGARNFDLPVGASSPGRCRPGFFLSVALIKNNLMMNPWGAGHAIRN